MNNTPTPGQGWRLLKEGEWLEKGDEYWSSNRWVAITHNDTLQSSCDIYRRKVESSDGWIKLSDRLPDKFPCQAWNGQVVFPANGIADLEFNIYGTRVTHWKPLQLSDPPKVENEDEVAWQRWITVQDGRSNRETHFGKRAWFAALEYARKTK